MQEPGWQGSSHPATRVPLLRPAERDSLIFRGTFEHSLDAKHRLTVPARYRATFADGAVLALSPETGEGTPRSIAIWRPADYDTYAATALRDAHPLSPRARDLKRVLYGNSFEVELDAANRLMIPARCLEYAALDREVLITGSGECLEIWDRAAWSAYNTDVLARFPQIAASFDHTD